MSASLQKLRKFFGDPLLVRSGRYLELTPRGLSLLGPVRETLLQIRMTIDARPPCDPASFRRDFTVISSADASLRIMPTVFRRLAREAPGIRCHLEHFSETTLSRLEQGDADLYIGLASSRLFGSRAFSDTMRLFDLWAVNWVCVVASDHPTVREHLSRAEYLELPHIFGWPSGHTIPLEELVRRLLGDDLDIRATAQSLFEIPFLLAGTPLVATLPEHLAETLAGLASVRILPLPFDAPDTREVVLWHERNDADPGHVWLRESIMAAAREISD